MILYFHSTLITCRPSKMVGIGYLWHYIHYLSIRLYTTLLINTTYGSRCSVSMMVTWENDGLLQANDGEKSIWSYTHFTIIDKHFTIINEHFTIISFKYTIIRLFDHHWEAAPTVWPITLWLTRAPARQSNWGAVLAPVFVFVKPSKIKSIAFVSYYSRASWSI